MSLDRFATAHADADSGYQAALAEIRSGRKVSHWIWYIFPQVRGLGHSYNANFFGIASGSEARHYFSDPVLGERLAEITHALAAHELPLGRVLGLVDAQKVVSSLTLFIEIAAEYTDVELPWCSRFERAAEVILRRAALMGAGRCQQTLAFLRVDGGN